jgi:mRNA-degrading endonuclease RelE of RelBE toxin-antitoxin system
MIHHTSSSFWKCYYSLSEDIQDQADKRFDLLKENPRHPSLHFKKIGKYWSVRASDEYRALGSEVEDGIVWFWIGTHPEYDRLVSRQKRR